MATTPFSSEVLWGASKPMFSLIGGDPQLEKLTGTWTWTESSTAVTVDEDVTGKVIVNDRIKAFENGKFWTVLNIAYNSGTDVTTITLTSAFDEAPDLVTNGNFAAWSTDNPVGWTVLNEDSAAGNIVTQGTGEQCIIRDTGVTDVGIRQSIFVALQQYRVTMDIKTVTAGGLIIGIGGRRSRFTTTGIKTWTAHPANTNLTIGTGVAASDVEIDDVTAIRFSDEGFIDRSGRVELPHTSDTLFQFTAERNDGGAATLTLESGERITRSDGYRVHITLSWRRMDRFNFKKIVQIRNWIHVGQIILIPHEDVMLRFDVLPAGMLAPRNPGDLFAGHQVTETYVSRKLIADIPTATAVGEFHPQVF